MKEFDQNHAKPSRHGRQTVHSRHARYRGHDRWTNRGRGDNRGSLLEAYPYLEREDVMQALRYAAWRAQEREIFLADA